MPTMAWLTRITLTSEQAVPDELLLKAETSTLATAGDTNTFIPDASDDDTIDLGTAAQGWLVGGVIRLVATSAAVWHCEAFLHGDGTLATPFE